MADNYLGRKMEEYEAQKCASVRTRKVSLLSLLARNRSTRGFDASFKVRRDQLVSLVEAARLAPSAMNQQVLRFRLVTEEEAHLVTPHIRLGRALPELKLPLEGTEPNGYVVICTDKESRYVDMDMGIATQTMLLRAVEMGLNGICIAAFDHEAVREALNLPLTPQLILAVGRSAERIEVVDISEGESTAYYRENGTHFVPKLRLEDFIINK
ncbi:MAG: nitroreductase family protein [Alistipes sp.]|nr:nitroreductase family protein [Alistipes sp.]